MNQSAVTIQRWYRRHAERKHSSQAALRHILAEKRKVLVICFPCLAVEKFVSVALTLTCPLQELEESKEDGQLEQQQRKTKDRKRIREEKARLARLAAIHVQTLTLLVCFVD